MLINEAKPSTISMEEQLDNLYSIIPTVEESGHSDTLGLLYYFISYRHSELNQMKELLASSTASIDLFEKAGYNGYQLVFNYFFRAKAHKYFGQNKMAFQDAEVVSGLASSGRALEVLDDAQRLMSEIHRENGEYESAINQLEYFFTTDGYKHIDQYSKGTLLLDLSLAYSNYSDSASITKAISLIQKSDELLPDISHPLRKENLQLLNTIQLGFMYHKNNDFPKAINIYKSILDLIDKKSENPDHKRYRLTAIANLISFYSDTGVFSKAKELIENLDSEQLAIISEDFIEPVSVLHENIADYYSRVQEFDSAKQEIQKAYEVLNVDTEDKTSPVLTNEKRHRIAKILLCEIELQEKLFIQQGDSNNLFIALDKMFVLDTIIDYINQNLLFTSSILNWRNEAKSFYEAGVRLSYQLNDHDSFWWFIEKAKGLALLEGMSNDKYFRTQEELIAIGNQLKQLQLENAKLKSEQAQEDLLVENIKSQKDLLQNRNALLKKKIPDILRLQDQFRKNGDQWLIQYFISDTIVYAITVNGENSEIFSLGHSEQLLSDIDKFRFYLNAEIENQENYIALTDVLKQLFAFLIEPLQVLDGHLEIIPDGNLFLLPFGCLIEDDDQFFIQDHSIQYQLSASLAKNNDASQEVSSSFVLAPDYEGTQYDVLSHTSEEAKSVIDYTFRQEKESHQKSKLIQRYLSADLFHFAGHAFTNEQSLNSTFLALSDTTRLTEEEIYNYPNNLKMAVLSACNTGIGEILEGEGVSNLTRSFTYSGAASVVQSLWSINDASSYNVVTEFYQHLRAGEHKSKALQSAKLSFLNSADDFQKHPYYWSSLVLVGNDVPLEFSTQFYIMWIGMFLALLVGGYLFIKLIRKSIE